MILNQVAEWRLLDLEFEFDGDGDGDGVTITLEDLACGDPPVTLIGNRQQRWVPLITTSQPSGVASELAFP